MLVAMIQQYCATLTQVHDTLARTFLGPTERQKLHDNHDHHHGCDDAHQEAGEHAPLHSVIAVAVQMISVFV